MDSASLKKYIQLKMGLIEEELKHLDGDKELSKEQFIIGMSFQAQLGILVDILVDLNRGAIK
jgi:hypothetical protein